MRPSISCRSRAFVAATWLLSACAALPDAPPDDHTLAGFYDGLSSVQQQNHLAGDAQFGRVFAPVDGLGPIFVAPSCESCHAGDGKGHPVFGITRFGRAAANGFDPMHDAGGPQLQNRAILTYLAEEIPAGITGASVFLAPSVTGLGLLEAVSDETLIAMQDSADADGDGISGRLQLIGENDMPPGTAPLSDFVLRGPGPRITIDGKYIGRFGKKAAAVNLLQQTVFAYREDIGITSDLAPADPVNARVGVRTGDATPDPEIGSSAIDEVVFYLRTLRAPPRRDAGNADVRSGEAAFVQIGCASCHKPTLTTGASTISVLDHVTFHPFTDLLLHDMGSELDDKYTEGRALTSEWRTAPLWGIGLAERSQGGSAFYLHDGRARTLEAAIVLHGGEGAASRAAFNALSPDMRARVIRYLRSL